MAQYDFGTIDPNTKSGTALASDLNSWRNAVHSTHGGSSAPSYIVAGMLWVDTTSANYELKLYDGAQSIPVAIIDATNNVARVAVDSAETSYITSTTAAQIRHVIASTDIFTTRSTGIQFNIASPVIADSNNNELISFTTTASAVNQIGIANAATGGAATISAVGGDTNISLALTPKGTGGVGIGTAPSYKLDVFGSGSQTVAVRAATSGDARFYTECAGTNSGWMQYTRSLQALQFSANGSTQHLTLDSSGNLGLGVTPTAWGGGFKTIQMTAGASFGGHPTVPLTYVNANTYFDGSNNRYVQNGFSSRFVSDGNSGGFAWSIAPSGTAGNAITFTQAMTLDASGNLFVGGTTGTSKLNTENSVSTAYSASNTLAATPVAYFYNSNGTAGTAGTIRLDGGSSGGNAATSISAVHIGSGSSALTFGTRLSNSDVTERLRIASAGQIGIGGANYGTSGQVLTSGGSGAAPSWASPSSYTVLGTINTTSGTSQTLSGLTLTDYTAMVLEFNDVAVNSGLTNFNLRINSTTGPLISGNWLGTSTDGWFGLMTINLATGVYSSTLAVVGGTIPFGAIGAVASGDCNVTTASTSVTIALSNNSFAAGSIRVYGVK